MRDTAGAMASPTALSGETCSTGRPSASAADARGVTRQLPFGGTQQRVRAQDAVQRRQRLGPAEGRTRAQLSAGRLQAGGDLLRPARPLAIAWSSQRRHRSSAVECSAWSSETCPVRSGGRMPLAEKGVRGKGRQPLPSPQR
ncbi:MAG: hypothetical protein M1570_03280 [Chloroflexi bacterium]|nr:hypothetical protein [Chloroflexota bacterium]